MGADRMRVQTSDKNILMKDLFLTNTQIITSQDYIIDGLDWLFVNYCDVYQLFELSFWRHPFTGEQVLNFCKSVLMKKQTHLVQSEGEYMFNKCSFLGELFL